MNYSDEEIRNHIENLSWGKEYDAEPPELYSCDIANQEYDVAHRASDIIKNESNLKT